MLSTVKMIIDFLSDIFTDAVNGFQVAQSCAFHRTGRAEMQKQGSNPADPAITQQISSAQSKLNQDSRQLLQQKNQLLQQLQQVQTLELDKEVSQGQIDGFFNVAVGDHMIKKMQVEILLRDGVVEEIRGEM